MREPIFLRADDEAAAIAALPLLRNQDGSAWRASFGHAGALDVIGAIVDQPAQFDAETGDMTAQPTFLPGWHANFYPGREGDAEADALLAQVLASGLAIAPPARPARLPAGYVMPPQSEGEGG